MSKGIQWWTGWDARLVVRDSRQVRLRSSVEGRETEDASLESCRDTVAKRSRLSLVDQSNSGGKVQNAGEKRGVDGKSSRRK